MKRLFSLLGLCSFLALAGCYDSGLYGGYSDGYAVQRVSSTSARLHTASVSSRGEGMQVRGQLKPVGMPDNTVYGKVRVSVVDADENVVHVEESDNFQYPTSRLTGGRREPNPRYKVDVPVTPPAGGRVKVEHVPEEFPAK